MKVLIAAGVFALITGCATFLPKNKAINEMETRQYFVATVVMKDKQRISVHPIGNTTLIHRECG